MKPHNFVYVVIGSSGLSREESEWWVHSSYWDEREATDACVRLADAAVKAMRRIRSAILKGDRKCWGIRSRLDKNPAAVCAGVSYRIEKVKVWKSATSKSRGQEPARTRSRAKSTPRRSAAFAASQRRGSAKRPTD